MVDLTKLALFNHYTTLCKHSTDSAIAFTALRNVNTATCTDNLAVFLLVVDRGIEPATFRFVAQHLNHCATAVPNK